MYALVLCYFYIISIFILLHCLLSGPDLIYIALLIIPCIIYYVTNKETLTLNLENQRTNMWSGAEGWGFTCYKVEAAPIERCWSWGRSDCGLRLCGGSVAVEALHPAAPLKGFCWWGWRAECPGLEGSGRVKPEVRCWKKGNLSESRGITLVLLEAIYLLSLTPHTHTTHTHAQTQKSADTHACTCTHTLTRRHRSLQTRTHVHTHTHIYTHTQRCTSSALAIDVVSGGGGSVWSGHGPALGKAEHYRVVPWITVHQTAKEEKINEWDIYLLMLIYCQRHAGFVV